LGELGVDWEDNIKTDIKDVGSESMDWIYLAPDKDQCQESYEKDNEPPGSMKASAIISVSRRTLPWSQ